MTRIALIITLGVSACFSELPLGTGTSGMGTSGMTSGTGTSSTGGATSDVGTGGTNTTGTSDAGSTGTSDAGSIGSTDTDTEGAPNVYGHCVSDVDCDPGLFCISTDGVKEGIEPTGFCSRTCTANPDCPDAPPGSDAIPTCTYWGPSLVCMLQCVGGLTCPADLECLDVIYTPSEFPDATLMTVCA